ncbi:hypothetical protein CCL08_00485 [Pseudomonas congelans]|uniref:SHOCT domain-containing protein n=1 Tax=Pseudomonas congelans TaxID=200452 RepID=UPI000BB911D3|nr:SHOCT domain-containing protein [Pseudomonas congelans]PBQ22283.1 hypothetical protein CCL08_00485 [Pseudomonas congelans]
MSNLPFTAKGSNGEITFTGSEVLIRRTGLLGGLRQFSGMGKGNKDIPISAISAIRLEPASLLNKAFFQVIHAGDLAFRGGSTNIAKDDNSVFFGKGSNADFEQIKKMILEAVAASHQPAKTSSASTEDIPAMLKKLSDLKDQGVLTEDEFLIKKADLLSRM